MSEEEFVAWLRAEVDQLVTHARGSEDGTKTIIDTDAWVAFVGKVIRMEIRR